MTQQAEQIHFVIYIEHYTYKSNESMAPQIKDFNRELHFYFASGNMYSILHRIRREVEGELAHYDMLKNYISHPRIIFFNPSVAH